ncbi:MAG: hypothetical protein EAY81_05610 [Bacteroidetes bacterium]|nr:MAG: hypothetical protein EAY81_05610 [Bacteroidota bacterium]
MVLFGTILNKINGKIPLLTHIPQGVMVVDDHWCMSRTTGPRQQGFRYTYSSNIPQHFYPNNRENTLFSWGEYSVFTKRGVLGFGFRLQDIAFNHSTTA